MKSVFRHKGITVTFSVVLLAGIWVALAILRPPVSKASTLNEMQAFVFPQVTLVGGQVAEICGTNMGDGSISGLVGLLDTADTSQALVETPFTFDARKGSCMHLSAAGIPSGAPGPPTTTPPRNERTVIAFFAFNSTTQWQIQGKTFIASLQVRDGASNTLRFAAVPTFLPAVQIPTPSPTTVP